MIRVLPNPESLARAAAEIFVTRARHAVEASGRFAVVLSGGKTPRRAYELLSRPLFTGRVPWDDVHVFWGDERYVPPDDPQSNARMAREALLDHVSIPQVQVHPIDCSLPPRDAAARYEALLREFFAGQEPAMDLVFLGLGENGHTASLFPGSPVLEEKDRWVAEVYVAESNKYRLTMTAPFINQAAMIIFLVSGTSKAAILRDAIQGDKRAPPLPVHLIRPVRGEAVWLVDSKAAAFLSLTP